MASKYVVTAAHCMFYDNKPVPKSDIKVSIGDYNVSSTGETTIEKTIGVANIFNHESYTTEGDLDFINDITVLELEEELDLNTYTPACLAQTSDNDTFNGKMAQVYGWGELWCRGPYSDTLREVSVPVVSNSQCATSMKLRNKGQICAGGEDGKDSCQVT